MIEAVKTPLQRQQFLRAAQGHDYFRATLGMRLALYADAPGAGWRFFTCGRGGLAALAVRGGAAFACGSFEPEELGALLRFLGAETLLTPEDAPFTAHTPEVGVPKAEKQTPAAGYVSGQALTLYSLAPGDAVPLPPKPNNLRIESEPPMQAVTRLLWGEGPEADAFYGEACAARNRGLAEYRLAYMADEAVATVGAEACFGGESYLACGQTRPAWRGRGIAGYLIAELANARAAAGDKVTFACEPALCPFYRRLGFAESGRILRWQAETVGRFSTND